MSIPRIFRVFWNDGWWCDSSVFLVGCSCCALSTIFPRTFDISLVSLKKYRLYLLSIVDQYVILRSVMCGAVWYALYVLSMGDDHKKGLFLWSSPIGVHGLHCSDELMWEQHVHIKLEPFPLYLTFIYELLFMKHVLLSWSAASLFLVMTSSVVLVCSFVLFLIFALPVSSPREARVARPSCLLYEYIILILPQARGIFCPWRCYSQYCSGVFVPLTS